MRSPLLLLPLLVGCAHARFRDAPIAWSVDDTADIAMPAERPFYAVSYMADAFVMDRSVRALGLPVRSEARNTNALDEVPDSSWFTNRIGVRDLSPEEVANGPVEDGPPVLPLVVVRGKSGGGNPGFFARDTTGRTFLIKFDTMENPEQQTAAAVIVNRAFWAAGYFVPSDTLFHFGPDDLSIDADATLRDELGRKRPVEQADVDAVLASSPRRPDGSFRALASEFVAGPPVGGFAMRGVRKDDPNDTIPHQHRREIRGLRALAAWLNHTDMKEDNTLDAWVEEDGRHYLRHYLVDFGEALGAHQSEKGRLEDGFEHTIDWRENTKSLLALGLWTRPWERQVETPWPAVGPFQGTEFEPSMWREAYPYYPFMEADAADLYWGAKLVMRMSRAHVEAIVAEGGLSEPEASSYLVEALMLRREKIGQVWLDGVTPLDAWSIDDELCATDLAIAHGVAASGTVEGGGSEVPIGPDGRVCLPRGDGRYEVSRLRVRRDDGARPWMEVHYRGGDAPRILGIRRTLRSGR